MNFNLIILIAGIVISLIWATITMWQNREEAYKLRIELNRNPLVRFYSNTKVGQVPKFKILHFLSIPTTVDLAISENRLYILPIRLSIFSQFNLVPSVLNLRHFDLTINKYLDQSIKLEFGECVLLSNSGFKDDTEFNLIIKFPNSINRDEVFSQLLQSKII
mgnify:CR=1 FL=1